MTEREWLTSTSAQRMLQYLLPHSPDRKLRLFAAACYHRIMPLLADRTRCDRARTSVAFMRRAQRAVRVAERLADGEVDDAERVAARETIREGTGAAAWTAFAALADPCRPVDAGNSSILAVVWAVGEKTEAARKLRKELRLWQRRLVREFFGNPFRPVALDPAWLAWNDHAVTRLAERIYEDRDFDRLPLLADALEEAGCGERALLQHLRGSGPHCRGCWALDAVLGKNKFAAQIV